jgi:hypothetical protein
VASRLLGVPEKPDSPGTRRLESAYRKAQVQANTAYHAYRARGARRTRACFYSYTTAMEHSPTSVTGTAWERTPWQATQRAAWE